MESVASAAANSVNAAVNVVQNIFATTTEMNAQYPLFKAIYSALKETPGTVGLDGKTWNRKGLSHRFSANGDHINSVVYTEQPFYGIVLGKFECYRNQPTSEAWCDGTFELDEGGVNINRIWSAWENETTPGTYEFEFRSTADVQMSLPRRFLYTLYNHPESQSSEVGYGQDANSTYHMFARHIKQQLNWQAGDREFVGYPRMAPSVDDSAIWSSIAPFVRLDTLNPAHVAVLAVGTVVTAIAAKRLWKATGRTYGETNAVAGAQRTCCSVAKKVCKVGAVGLAAMATSALASAGAALLGEVAYSTFFSQK